ncbi:hypothetical protein O181_059344 [Austropuccinia psidii MF-1]|uniref:Copia protein n=1 Tax=Austropuccinia psidii MF-1 TaxID=1389203 RepID=A0A9Q3EE39_9BASI|nr:hypothetical protein [Austropuccinia psidii MF-1]
MHERHQEARVVAYSDEDWGNCRINRRLTTGFVILIGDCLVTWKTQKQPTVSLSTSEAEYKALANLTTEVLWLRQLIQELNLMTIFDDNKGCINTANEDCNSNGRRMKHIKIQLHFIKE